MIQLKISGKIRLTKYGTAFGRFSRFREACDIDLERTIQNTTTNVLRAVDSGKLSGRRLVAQHNHDNKDARYRAGTYLDCRKRLRLYLVRNSRQPIEKPARNRQIKNRL